MGFDVIGPLNTVNAPAVSIQKAHSRNPQEALANNQQAAQKQNLERVRAFDEELAASNRGAAQNNRSNYEAGGSARAKLGYGEAAERGSLLDVVV